MSGTILLLLKLSRASCNVRRCLTRSRNRSRAAIISSSSDRGKYLRRISSKSLSFLRPNIISFLFLLRPIGLALRAFSPALLLFRLRLLWRRFRRWARRSAADLSQLLTRPAQNRGNLRPGLAQDRGNLRVAVPAVRVKHD